MKRKDLFWPAFVGLLTIMFVIMLVLFGLSFKVFTQNTIEITEQNKRLKGLEKEYLHTRRVNSEIESLASDTVFEYLPSCNKFVVRALKGKEIFVCNSAEIKEAYLKEMIVAGHSLEAYINRVNKADWRASFLLIVEGHLGSWCDNNIPRNSDQAYHLSYQRALGVFRLWEKAGIVFKKQNVEILISGRAFGGQCRTIHGKDNYFVIQLLSKRIGDRL
jgi:hypothetical protein